MGKIAFVKRAKAAPTDPEAIAREEAIKKEKELENERRKKRIAEEELRDGKKQ